MDDREIIDLFFERSERAVTECSAKYGSRLRGIAANILGDAGEAEECENDTYMSLWSSIPPKRPQSLAAYACRIARNKAIKRYRAKTARKRDSRYELSLEELEGCLSSENQPEEHIQAAELGWAINVFLAGLKAEDRRIFLRRYYFADSIGEIAAELGSTENRISLRLFRIREKLRNHLEKEGLLP